jgi:predicted amidophosphoribosyltransferase
MLFGRPESLLVGRWRVRVITGLVTRLGARDLRCPVCRAEVEEDYLVCPVCTTKLRQACTGCGRPLESSWQVCPYCATEIAYDENAPVALVEAKKQRPPRARRQSR